MKRIDTHIKVKAAMKEERPYTAKEIAQATGVAEEGIKAAALGLPRYTEWCHLREKGVWSKGVPAWAKDHEGRMNDHCAAMAVIEELAATIDAHIAATGEPVGYFIETSPGSWGQAAEAYINDPSVVPLYASPQPPGQPRAVPGGYAITLVREGLIRISETTGTKESPGQSALIDRSRYPVEYGLLKAIIAAPQLEAGS